MPKSKGRRHKQKAKVSRIDQHKRTGKQLEPAWVQAMGTKLTYQSWRNDQLPEMLWASLMLAYMERSEAFGEFIRIIQFVQDHERKAELKNLTITGIAEIEGQLKKEVIAFITSHPRTAQALATLKIFEELPSKEDWEENLRGFEPRKQLLVTAVGDTLNYASVMSTDCCWVTASTKLAAGEIKISRELTGLINALETYPAMEPGTPEGARIRVIGKGPIGTTGAESAWSNAFWDENWKKTPCVPQPLHKFQEEPTHSTTRQGIIDLAGALTEHWKQTHSTTAVDAKHDATFGAAFYSLRILTEMMTIGTSNGILGRLGLRTILETRINLKYLIDKDSADLWQKWRRYGAGQAKLASLKFDDSEDVPEFIRLDVTEGIAYEDLREELLTIDLGNWAGSNLREISKDANLKETYDDFYTWSSAYVHAAWGAIRESSFQTCANPLHRLHRYPERQPLQDCLYDAVTLVDDILNHVDSEYPFFPHRLLKNSRQEQSAPRSDKKTEIPQPSPAAKGGNTEVE